MEIPDIAKIVKQKEKKMEKQAFKLFPSEFFKSKGGKIKFIEGNETHKYFEVK